MVGSSIELMIYAVIRLIVSSLPWLLIALIGVIAFLRTRSIPTLIQAIGAIILFFGGICLMFLPYLIRAIEIPMSSYMRVTQILSILVGGLGTLLFATGYIIEKIRQSRPDDGRTAFPITPADQSARH
jgi:hypothetical protein